eukprot:TRINITY_DN40579_c0_g1_i1.p1 TRINITY_DN40579_c0_g1~~TRINITY_DN40579_c0_g1_i1.p1  ORF type:complete len:775 (+),score=213.73 TRINITY_DN40579_c0_g1_i1:65-2326(+)
MPAPRRSPYDHAGLTKWTLGRHPPPTVAASSPRAQGREQPRLSVMIGSSISTTTATPSTGASFFTADESWDAPDSDWSTTVEPQQHAHYVPAPAPNRPLVWVTPQQRASMRPAAPGLPRPAALALPRPAAAALPRTPEHVPVLTPATPRRTPVQPPDRTPVAPPSCPEPLAAPPSVPVEPCPSAQPSGRSSPARPAVPSPSPQLLVDIPSVPSSRSVFASRGPAATPQLREPLVMPPAPPRARSGEGAGAVPAGEECLAAQRATAELAVARRVLEAATAKRAAAEEAARLATLDAEAKRASADLAVAALRRAAQPQQPTVAVRPVPVGGPLPDETRSAHGATPSEFDSVPSLPVDIVAPAQEEPVRGRAQQAEPVREHARETAAAPVRQEYAVSDFVTESTLGSPARPQLPSPASETPAPAPRSVTTTTVPSMMPRSRAGTSAASTLLPADPCTRTESPADLRTASPADLRTASPADLADVTTTVSPSIVDEAVPVGSPLVPAYPRPPAVLHPLEADSTLSPSVAGDLVPVDDLPPFPVPAAAVQPAPSDCATTMSPSIVDDVIPVGVRRASRGADHPSVTPLAVDAGITTLSPSPLQQEQPEESLPASPQRRPEQDDWLSLFPSTVTSATPRDAAIAAGTVAAAAQVLTGASCDVSSTVSPSIPDELLAPCPIAAHSPALARQHVAEHDDSLPPSPVGGGQPHEMWESYFPSTTVASSAGTAVPPRPLSEPMSKAGTSVSSSSLPSVALSAM